MHDIIIKLNNEFEVLSFCAVNCYNNYVQIEEWI